MTELDLVYKSIAAGRNLIHPLIQQQCLYCGVGQYEPPNGPQGDCDTIKRSWQQYEHDSGGPIRGAERRQLRHAMGLKPDAIINVDMKILRCNFCGNVQMFWPNDPNNTRICDIERRWYEP